MIRKLNKIACITISIFLLMLSPIGSYIQGENAKAYAFGIDIENAMAQFMFPIVAWVANQQLLANGAYDTFETTSQDVADIIDTLNASKSMYFNYLSLTAKVKLTKLYTDMSDYDINKMFGTTFSSAQMQEMTTEVDNMKTKISNNGALTNKDLYDFGIHNLLAKYLEKYSNTTAEIADSHSYSDLTIKDISGITYVTYTSNGYTARTKLNLYDNTDFIRFIDGNYNYSCLNGSLSSGSYTNFSPNLIYKMNLSSDYYLTFIPNAYAFRGSNTSTYVDMILSNMSATSSGFTAQIKNIIDNSIVKTMTVRSNTTTLEMLNFIKDYCLSDLVSSDYYKNYNSYSWFDLFNLGKLGTVTYTKPVDVSGQYSIDAILSKVIDPLTTVPDTSLSQAERIIASQDPTVTYDNNIKVIPNSNTGDNDIVISPPAIDGIPSTSTAGDGATVDPDTGAVVDADGKAFNIPILGTLLSWLIKIWNMLKSIFDTITHLFTNSGTANEGIDWGNFKGLFDIFYIFYYLIIIVILILIKFLAVVFNLLSIPANSALFNSYPTMLAGLNYIKNIKVGGFNITLQQIFEYMFTIFFFLFIVTVLQKLYHSFSGIERQTLNQEQKWDNNQNIYQKDDGTYVNKRTGEIQDYKYK